MKMKKDINLLAASGTQKKFDMKANADAVVTILIVIVIGICAYLYVSAFTKKRTLTSENQTLVSYINNPVHQKEIDSLTEKQQELSDVNNSIESAKKILAYVNEQGDIFPALTPQEIKNVQMYLTINGCAYNSISYEGASAIINASFATEAAASDGFYTTEAVQSALNSMKVFSDISVNYDVESGSNDFSLSVKLRNLQLILNEMFDNVNLKNFTYNGGTISFEITSTYSRETVISYYQALKNLEGVYFKQDGVGGFTGVTERLENVQGSTTTVYSIQSVSCSVLTREG